IDFASSPFYLNTEALDWAQGPEPRRASVSSFGFGGSNVHLVLDEYQAPPVPASSRREHLYVLSARSETALAQRTSDPAVCLEANPDFHAADVAHTLQNGRQEMEYRSFVTVDEDTFKPQDLNHRAPQSGAVVSPQARPLVFLFPGQGAQRPGMGQEIYAREEVYRQTVDHCAEILEPELGFDIRTLIHTESGAEDSAEILRQTANAQPALFVVEYALAKLFQSWGVTPTAMLGHSIGEVVAACLAGVFSLKDALKLVALRAKLMQQCEPGAMSAVFLGEKELSDRLPDGTEIAALNAPGLSVVSGPSDDISAFISKMNEAGIGSRPLQTSHAFHSWMMEPALPKFRTLLKSIELHPPEMPVISNATGLELTDKQALDPDYWSDHLRHTVRFSDGMAHLLAGTEPVFLELGPGHSLSDLARRHNPELDTLAALDSTNPRPGDNQSHTALGALGAIWCAGAPVRWRDYYGDESRRGVRLPTYPFERRRYWLEEGDFETTPVEPLNMYRPGWRMAEPETETPENDQRPWLIFRDQCGLGLAISERLKEAGNDVISVLPGEAFDEVEPGTFTVRPGSREDLREALGKACVLNGGQTPRVLHLWSVTGPEGPHNTLEAFEGSVLTGYHTLLALIQAAYDKGICDELDVTVIADGLRQMDGEDVPTYGEKGSLFGTVRSAPQELPGLMMRCVDISGCVGETTPGWLTDAAIAEALSENRELLVLLRSTGRFVEELYPLTDLPLGKLRLRDQGTVLITGGVGGLGLKVAGTLFDAAAARLVLTSRWQPPPREDWPQRALEDDRIGRALKGILALEARGAEIMIVTTDIGDRDSLKSAVTQAESQFGKINGVVHAAAVGNDLPAINETRENAERVFPAKVHGAFNLEEIFADAPLDFFVYFSSQVTYFPDVGQSLYTACNGVLDALARRRAHKTGGLSCAIGWGAWEEIGLGAEHAGSRPRSAEETSTIDAGAAVTGTVDHPLIQTRHDGDEGEVFYRGILRKGDNWVFDHAFKGRTLLPGVAIFDSIHTTYSDHAATAPWAADDCAEYSQIVFLRPLFIDDEGTEIEIRFIAENERERVEVRSKPADQQAPWILNTTAFAKMNRVPRSGKAISVPDDLVEETIPRTQVTSISFNRRWDCVPGNRAEGDETWGRLRLPEEFESDMGTYSSHPALLDRSLIMCTDRF
ncbi:MAG: SDR family NAD(P)-dependent oxidoreductase, partial [Alphaproteobacteria bacterium]|nr:SDR family NAD(P)-dependent oxidoreductase [Alphaproteobacteria bacterium]